MILVVSFPEEEHSQVVIGILRRLGRKVELLDLADFPAERSLTMRWEGGTPACRVEGRDGALDLAEARVCWWRRVRPFTPSPAVTRPDDRAFVVSETTQALYGLLDTLPCAWVNPHAADEMAHHKPLQWTVAGQVGLPVPRTLVTSDPAAARAFLAGCEGRPAVFKAFIASLEAWRETRLVEPADLDRLDSVRLAPVIFQDYVPGVDLRITIIGTRVFAAEIDARRTSYPYDMRMVVGEAEVRPVQLPDAVERALLALMKRLGIVYGAVDMRRTDAGEHLFLEVNPAGQWLFVEERTGLPIAAAVADHLATLDGAGA